MHEINAVLAGTFDAPDYAPSNNFAPATNPGTNATSAVSDVASVDSRRYTKFDHSDTEAGTANLSFSDFIDMINPLEHIPVVSSIYRAIAGENINPVSRVVGDILYGGVLGAGSAVFGGVSAIADAGLEEQTGKDSGGLAVAALFGDDKKDAVQLADAGATTNAANKVAATGVNAPPPAVNSSPTTQNLELAQSATPTPLLAALALPASSAPPTIPAATNTGVPSATAPSPDAAPVAPVNSIPAASPVSPPPAPAAVPITQNTPPTADVTLAAATAPATAAPLGGIPLAPLSKSPAPGSKQPFGGVMGTPDVQAQDMAMAIAQGTPGMRMGHMIYTNNLVNGQHPLPPKLSNMRALSGPPVAVIAPKPTVPAPTFTPVSTSPSASLSNNATLAAAGAPTSPNSQTLPAAMMQDMMLKALSQYGQAAAGPSSGAGASLNLMN